MYNNKEGGKNIEKRPHPLKFYQNRHRKKCDLNRQKCVFKVFVKIKELKLRNFFALSVGSQRKH